MTFTSQSAHPDTMPVNGSATRIRVVAGALGAAALTAAALLVSTPWGDRYSSSADEVIAYEHLDTVPDGAWIGMLTNGVAIAVLYISLGLVACHLVRGRGRFAALLGALAGTVGGILSAMGNLSFATFVWFASRLSEDVGRPLVDYANDNPGHLLGATMAGFFLSTLAQLALATALLRARAVPVAAVAAYLLLIPLQFAPIPGRVIDLLQIVMMALYVALAVTVLRRPAT
ncbi:MAG: hypothetical protein WKF96_15140 [Solirubrobacteraceae bacterium]